MPTLTVRNINKVDSTYRGSVDVYQRQNVGDTWQYVGTLTSTQELATFSINSGWYVKATPTPVSPYIFYKWCYYTTGTSCGIDCTETGCSNYIPTTADKSLASWSGITSDWTYDAYFVLPCSNIENYYRTTLLYYDANKDGKINKSEYLTAIVDYFAARITKDQIYAITDFYIQNCTLSASTLATITISPTSAIINAGDTRIFTITAYDQFNVPVPNASVTWVNTNGSAGTLTPISTVTDTNGQATARFNAAAVQVNTTTLVYAYSGTIGGYAAEITVVPVIIFTSIDLYPTSTTISVNGTQQFTATCKDQYGNNMACPSSVTWTSDNTSTATIASIGTLQGMVTGVSEGTTNIRATIGSTSRSASVTVTPVIPVLTSITVSIANPNIGVGSATQASAICKDQFINVTTCPTITWTSDNTSIATVNSSTGMITGISVGTTNIRATSGTITGFAPVTISAIPPTPILTSITVSITNPNIGVTGTTQASATCKDQFTAIMQCPTITWTSDNTSVATVDPSTGVVTGISVGTTNIRATSGSVTGYATITVTTTGPVLNEIVVYPTNPTVSMGNIQQFFAICKDQDYNSMNCPIIIWDTTDHNLGIISSTGLFTALASSGTVTVTATSGIIIGSSIVILSAAPPVQAGFGTAGMILMAGLAVGAVYAATRPKKPEIKPITPP